MGKECIIVEGFTYRKDSILNSGEIPWRFTANKQKCRAKVRTDLDVSKALSGDLTHNHEANARKTERKILMVNVKRKVHEDVSARPSKLIRNELFEQCKEENVRTGDIISVRHALYRERRKRFPKLPEFREEVNTALENLRPTLTNKGEDFVLINDSVSGIVIFGTLVNLKFVCNDIKDIYADQTFKCCPKVCVSPIPFATR